MPRISKEQYYLNIAREVAGRSTCLRRKYGAVIVNNDQIISTGYCGAPRDTENCVDIGVCIRKQMNIKHGEHYEWCRSVHAEQNAIIHASRLEMMDSTLYLVGVDAETDEMLSISEPCKICKRHIINAGIKYVVTLNHDKVNKIDVKKEWTDKNIGEIQKINGKWVSMIDKE
ncbi:dCMP deaminase family protein [candidate division KSB1 bacterium]|nr:dCMP deaminase family protein [candidate division KSB1 bacterium]